MVIDTEMWGSNVPHFGSFVINCLPARGNQKPDTQTTAFNQVNIRLLCAFFLLVVARPNSIRFKYVCASNIRRTPKNAIWFSLVLTTILLGMGRAYYITHKQKDFIVLNVYERNVFFPLFIILHTYD